jgi:FG-GAP-like repeat
MRCPHVALFALLVAAPTPAAAAPAGTLDRLVSKFDARIGVALDKQRPKDLDLALWVGQGAGISPGLVRVVRELLLGRLNGRGFRRVELLKEGGGAQARRRRCRREGYERLLDLELIVVEGYLHLRGALIATEAKLWRDTLRPHRGSLSHLHDKVRVDAEVRAYTGRVTSGKVRFVTRAFGLPRLREVLALAVGDLDGDGRSELVLLRPEILEVLRYKGGQAGFDLVASIRVTPPSAPLRPRRAIGALVVADLDRDGKAEVLARSSTMKQGAAFGLRGKVLQRLKDLPGFPLAARPGRPGPELLLTQALAGLDLFDVTSLSGALAATMPQELIKALPSFYTMRVAAIAKRGRAPLRFAGAVDSGGALRVFAWGATTPLVTLSSVGIAFELADLDDDGQLEVVTTAADIAGEKDQITVSTAQAGKGARLVWRSADLQGAVVALCHGDIDGDGKLELVGALQSPRAARGGVTLVVLAQ